MKMGEPEYHGFLSKFVYYKDLQRTHKSLYDSLIKRKNIYVANYSAKMGEISSRLLNFASYEGQKEASLLKEYFNVQELNFKEEQFYTEDFGRKLVNAINTSLQLKEVYERNLTRIVGRNGKSHAKITAAQFFADYFVTALYELSNKKLKQLGEDTSNMSVEEIYEEIFSDEIINQALSDAFFNKLANSGDWDKNDENKGYKEFFNEIEKFDKEAFLREVSEVYKLRELRQRLIDEMTENKKFEDIFTNKRSAKSYIKKSLKESTKAKGTLAEILGNEAMLVIQKGLKNGSNYTISMDSKVVGDAGGKADIVATFGIDMEPLLEIINKHYNNRAETVEKYKELGNRLKNMKSGFIVYTNAKDYSLIKDKGNGGYFFSGFSAGSDISLKNLEGVIKNTPGGSQEIIGEIMNTMSGAVLDDQKERIESELCEKMAYFLFDDVTTIGKETAASSHAIHLLLLDGVYIPLSYLFYLMGTAVSQVGESKKYEAEDIINITITPGKTLYPSSGEEAKNFDWTNNGAGGLWTNQKIAAYDQIKIGTKFLKQFVDIVTEIKG